MVGGCNRGLCEKYRFTRGPTGSPRAGNVVYPLGGKYCTLCQVYLEWDGLYCPCCSYRLRTNPRGGKSKKKWRERNETS